MPNLSGSSLEQLRKLKGPMLVTFDAAPFKDIEVLVICPIDEPKESSAFKLAKPTEIIGEIISQQVAEHHVMYGEASIVHTYTDQNGITYHMVHKNQILASVINTRG